MRRTVRDQLPLVPASLDHEHARELQAVGAILDAHPEFARWVQADLLAGGIDADCGREGMSGEQVLRALVIKQSNGFSYEDLAFHLADSQSYRAFCLIGIADTPPKKSTLQRNRKSRASKMASACAATRPSSKPRFMNRRTQACWSIAFAYWPDCSRKPVSTSCSGTPTITSEPSAARWRSSMQPSPSSDCRCTAIS